MRLVGTWSQFERRGKEKILSPTANQAKIPRSSRQWHGHQLYQLPVQTVAWSPAVAAASNSYEKLKGEVRLQTLGHICEDIIVPCFLLAYLTMFINWVDNISTNMRGDHAFRIGEKVEESGSDQTFDRRVWENHLNNHGSWPPRSLICNLFNDAVSYSNRVYRRMLGSYWIMDWKG
jgi:hypothetical protein